MRGRLVVMWAVAMLLLAGCLDDPNAVVFGPGDLDAGAGDVDDGDSGAIDAEEPDTCVPGEAGCGPAHCGNGQQDGDETDVDCGGSCPGCEAGEFCASVDDCAIDEVLELRECERADVEVCAPRGVGVYQVGALACESEDGEAARCVARFSGNEVRLVADDAACEIDTDEVVCGDERVELGACLPGEGQACSAQGVRMVTTYQGQCAGGSCQEVVRARREESCTLASPLEPGDVCGFGAWSEWSDCEPEAGRDSCAAGGVQMRSRTIGRCTTNLNCSINSTEVETETRGCQLTPDPQLCSSTGADNSSFVCYQGQCCMPDCSEARLSCRAQVEDGCGGLCPRRTCRGITQGCAMDGQCRTFCGAATDSRTCENDAQCGQMCACPGGAAPRCGALGCTCL